MNKAAVESQQKKEMSRLPEFPRWVTTGVAGEFGNLYSKYIEAPREFLFFGFLCCLGSILAGKLTLKSTLKIATRFYMLFMGESGEARKSSAIKACVDFFREFLSGELNVCWGIGSAEGLQNEIKKSQDGRVLLCLDEIKSLASKMGIDGSVLLPCLNTLFEENHYQNSTKKVSVKIDNAQLSMMGASTTDTYETLWTPQFLDIGFTNRIFLVPGKGERRFPIPKLIPIDDQIQLAGEVKKLLLKVRDRGELEVTEEANAEFERWYLGLEKSPHTVRLDTYALRFMALIAINDRKKMIDLETVQKVIAIMDWQKTVRQLYDPIDAVTKIGEMEERIRRVVKARGPLTDGQLKNFTNTKRYGTWIYEMAKKNLSSGCSPDILLDPVSKKWSFAWDA